MDRNETPEEFRARVGTIGFGKRTLPTIHEGRRQDGVRTKATTDELGHTVTEHASKDDRVDVQIRAPHVVIKAEQTETRHTP